MLISKNTSIHQLKRENIKLQKTIISLKASIENQNASMVNESVLNTVRDDDNEYIEEMTDLNIDLDDSNLEIPL